MAEGSFLKKSNMPSSLTKSIDQASGQIVVEVSGSGADVENAGGSVATLVFEVIGVAPQSKISVSRIVSSGSGGDAPAFAEPEPHVLAVVQ